jgi:hypothetical protein
VIEDRSIGISSLAFGYRALVNPTIVNNNLRSAGESVAKGLRKFNREGHPSESKETLLSLTRRGAPEMYLVMCKRACLRYVTQNKVPLLLINACINLK